MVQAARLPEASEAVITASPIWWVVTTPSWVTEATLGLELLQLTLPTAPWISNSRESPTCMD